ncbi:MAG: precorrin-6y C5,15-methyltransferase (decarboxylating) subunit CbiE [Proteobacteria bacterium]|nr:precorrin-6y C5,15-methyltransferase (decarboxylating) subunit CbiE [Pseudomonadota bacterium]
MNPINIIGMGLSPHNLTSDHLSMIHDADILVGGKRHLACFPELSSEKISISSHVRDLALEIFKLSKTHKVVVLASGDPLYYGIGTVFVDVLGKEAVTIHPNVTSVAGAFARIKESWQDAGVISLHGRTMGCDLIDLIRPWDKVALFTDPKNNPALVAEFLLDQGVSSYEICVLECLGSDKEKVRWFELCDAAKDVFADPNMVILKRKKHGLESCCDVRPEALFLGMPDDCFAHQRGLITKAEIRVVSLARLCLLDHHVMWDLGAGSGSVSVEVAGFIKKGSIHAVEQHEDRIHDIKENIRRFGITNITTHQAELPQGMESLPDPDRIFVGGGGKNLGLILENACARLKQNGVIVVNTVLLSNVQAARDTLGLHGFETDLVQIQVSTGHAMPFDLMLKAHNPVFIIRGRKTL